VPLPTPRDAWPTLLQRGLEPTFESRVSAKIYRLRSGRFEGRQGAPLFLSLLQLMRGIRGADRATRVVLIVAFLFAVLRPMVAHGAALGEHYTYTDQTGRSWCATANAIAIGVDGLAWAWLTIDVDPRRVAHVPVSALRAMKQLMTRTRMDT
jgi:hypothetical protein